MAGDAARDEGRRPTCRPAAPVSTHRRRRRTRPLVPPLAERGRAGADARRAARLGRAVRPRRPRAARRHASPASSARGRRRSCRRSARGYGVDRRRSRARRSRSCTSTTRRARRCYHLDLYRLRSAPTSSTNIGWDEIVSAPALVLVEWPERAGDRAARRPRGARPRSTCPRRPDRRLLLRGVALVITLALEAATYARQRRRARRRAAPRRARGRDARARARERLMPADRRSCSTSAGVAPARLDRVVCGAGPGSFTEPAHRRRRSRRGWRWRRGVPLVAGAVARAARRVAAQPLAAGRYLAAIDALRGEHYVGAVRGRGERTRSRSDQRDAARAVGRRGRDRAPRHEARVVGPGQPERAAAPHARGAGPARRRLLDATAPADLAAWEPAYGRLAEAQVKWEAEHGRPLAGAMTIAPAIRDDPPCAPSGPRARRGDRARALHRPVELADLPRRAGAAALRFLVAEEAREWRGSAVRARWWAMLWRSSWPTRAEIANVAVAPAARGRGVGAALLERVDGGADATRGCARCYLEVRESNARGAGAVRVARLRAGGAAAGVLPRSDRGCAPAQARSGRLTRQCHATSPAQVSVFQGCVQANRLRGRSDASLACAARHRHLAQEEFVSRSLNKVTLIGNLGNDPEVRSTTGGNRVATFSLATSRSWNDASGDRSRRRRSGIAASCGTRRARSSPTSSRST